MKQGSKQLILQTGSLIAGLMVWVLISSLMPYIKEEIRLTSLQTAWVTAVPVILGSLLRIPIGYWTNRFGARPVFTISFFILIVPITMISFANSITALILGGVLLGIGGAVFSAGITSLPKYFKTNKQGFVNGIYGTGNIGTALTTFLAPLFANELGWRHTVQFYLVIVLLFALMNLLLGDRLESKTTIPIGKQIKEVYKNPELWFLSLFYFITFGSFVAFTIYLPSFLVGRFELTKIDSGIRTAGFIALATFFRPVGGWLGDKINPYFILITAFFSLTFAGFLLSFTPSLPIYSFGCLLVAIFAGLGNGAIFKLIPLYFLKQAGFVNGIVSAIGGLGGFFPPIILSILLKITGNYSIGFMCLSEFSLAALILAVMLRYKEKSDVSAEIINHSFDGICVTDVNGIIQNINPAFTKITGYTLKEVAGKTPSVLQSGEHPIEFYKEMWSSLLATGYWEGWIWNKRKNHEIYKEWLRITAIKDDKGQTKHFFGMFTEETACPTKDQEILR